MQAAEKVADWEFVALDLWLNHVCAEIQLHHHHEEKYFFPVIYNRCCTELKQRFSHSHEDLSVNLKAIVAATKEMVATKDEASLDAVATLVATCRDSMFPHLQEEEDDMLPAFRKHFEPEEVDAIMQPMIAELGWEEFPHFLR